MICGHVLLNGLEQFNLALISHISSFLRGECVVIDILKTLLYVRASFKSLE